MKKFITLVISMMLMLSITFANTFNPDINIQSSKVVLCTMENIVGNFEVKNNSDIYNSDIYYIVSLNILRPSIVGEEQTKYFKFYEYQPVQFEIGAKQTKNITFEYELPENIPLNNYAVSIQLYSKTLPIGYESYVNVGLLGTEEGFLDRGGFAHWEINDKKFGTLDGPNITNKDEVLAIVELKSNFEEDKYIRPQYAVYKRNQTYKEEPLVIEMDKKLLIKAGKTQKLELDLSELLELNFEFEESEYCIIDEPESYLVHLTFLDEKYNQISSIYEFRFVVVGASAKILSMNSKYDELNDEIDISINVIGPADSNDLEDAQISYKVYNTSDDSLILQKEITENLTKEVMTIEESIDANSITGSFKLIAEISYEDKTLATMENNIEVSKTKINEEMFTDLVGTKYLDAVKILNGLNILNGYPDGTFKPENPITRAEFTVIATKLANLTVADIQSTELRFSDVANEHWAKNFIILAYENSIISGYPDNTFKPDNNVTYQEALTILLNVMGYKWEVTKMNLDWPRGYIEMANQLNMMSQVGEVDYASRATRGDVALLTLKAYLSLINTNI